MSSAAANPYAASLLHEAPDTEGNASMSTNRFPLHAAARSGDSARVKQLLAAGVAVDVTSTADDGKTALHEAAFIGHTQVVQQLLAAGAAVNIRDGAGRSALLLAAKAGHAEVIQQLLKAGSAVDAVDSSESTALMEAAYYGRTGVVQALLAAGANVNAADNLAGTSLMFAAGGGHPLVVSQLLAAGADAAVVDIDGDTVLSWAAMEGRTHVVNLLLSEVSFETEALQHAAIVAGKAPNSAAGHRTAAAVAIVRALVARDADAALESLEQLLESPDVARSLLEAWMDDVSKVREVEQQRAGAQHIILGLAATHLQLRAAAGDITAAAVQAAADVLKETQQAA